MRSRCTCRLAALALLAALGAGCERPPDEAWLRFLGFQKTSGSGTSATTTSVVVLEGKLDATTDSVDALFENQTFNVGDDKAGGTGIFVGRARVEYSLPGASPPSYEYPTALYLAAPAKAGEPTKGTLSGLPIAPSSLKSWIAANVSPLGDEVHLTAHVTFFARTDDGSDIETSGGLAVVLKR